MKRSNVKTTNECSDELKILIDREPEIDDELIPSGFIQWQPYYDLYVLDDEIVVTLEMAGVEIKDVSIYAHKWHVSVDGNRPKPQRFTPDCCTFHNSEIPYGRFYRKIEFPLPVEPGNLRYEINNGLLTILFPIVKEKVIPIEDA